MYNYAVCQMNGRGTRKSIPEAVRWLEKAASMPIDSSPEAKIKNNGIGEAMASLGNMHDSGIHFPQDKRRAREYWERASEVGVLDLNNLGLCYMNGTGVKQDLARARDLFRRSVEWLQNEGMANLGLLHASLRDYETAARWADAAAKYGYIPAMSLAAEYRQLAKKKWNEPEEEVPEDMQGALATIMSLLNHRPDMTRDNATPTLEELRAIGTPYGNRLHSAKKLMADAVRAFKTNDFNKTKEAVLLACQARRIDDSDLVFSPKEARVLMRMAELVREYGVQVTADLALLSGPSDQASAVGYWKSMQLQFPNDLEITKRAALTHMFEGYAGADNQRGIALFQHAFTLLENPKDDSDPHTLDLLYVAGGGYFRVRDMKRAESLLTRFLKHAPADGHRKAAEANYFLGMIAMENHGDAHDKGQSVMTKYLEEGDRLLARIPAFLRHDAEQSSNRKMLETIVKLADTRPGAKKKPASTNTPTTPQPPTRRRGGELVDGPRRLEALRSDSPSLQVKWRTDIAGMVAWMAKNSHLTGVFMSTPPPRQPTRSRRNGAYSPATIDELFSALEDRVYAGRLLQCIVVSVPSFSGSSYHFLVEDSQREPTRMVVYNAPKQLIAQLTPGREFHLRGPYVRMAKDGSIVLRVDDPAAVIDVKALHVICWSCSVEQGAHEQPKRCAKCHKANYCSKECQAYDWRVNGRKIMCSELAKVG